MEIISYIWILMSVVAAILLLGIFMYIVMLRKMAEQNHKYFGDFAGKLIIGLSGGTIMYSASKLEEIFNQGITAGAIIGLLVVILSSFFILTIGAGLFILICKKNRKLVKN